MGMKLLDRSKILTTKGEVASLQSPDSAQVLELNYYEKDSEFASQYDVGEGLDHLAFKVNDVCEVLEDLRSRGVEIACEPFVETGEDGSSGTLGYVKDPNGIWIELFQ
jgi:4-hydroxyphenylpyruvate dioxygenase-like putative hemolysin